MNNYDLSLYKTEPTYLDVINMVKANMTSAVIKDSIPSDQSVNEIDEDKDLEFNKDILNIEDLG